MSILTLDEVKKKTMELLETEDPNDVSYITQEMIEEDSKVTDEDEIDFLMKSNNLTKGPLYGHNMRYGSVTRNGRNYSVYLFNTGSDYTKLASACGNKYTTAWARQAGWNHQKIGSCSGGDAKIKFTLR